MRRAVRVSKVGLATTGLLVIAGLATTALVTRSAREIAGDKPYCIQVADSQADYRPARTLLELSGLMMRAKIFDQHHAILVVGDETHPGLFHWSYHKARFVPGVLNAAIPGHEPALSCKSRRDFIGTLPALWAPPPESTYVHFSEHEDLSGPDQLPAAMEWRLVRLPGDRNGGAGFCAAHGPLGSPSRSPSA